MKAPVVPTHCPHCPANPGTVSKLDMHLRFECPVLRPKPAS